MVEQSRTSPEREEVREACSGADEKLMVAVVLVVAEILSTCQG